MATTRTRLVAAAGALVAAVTCSACGSGSGSPATTTTTAAGVQKLAVTPALSAALLKAGAKAHGLPSHDFVRLTAGRTYYAYDPATMTYWAGAQLVPSMGNIAAQVVVQDDGAYDVFVRHPGVGWTAYEDGLGTQPHTRCSIVVPTAVRTVWGWSTSTPCGGPQGI